MSTPQDLGNGLTLLSSRTEGKTWFRTVVSDAALEPPNDQQFRGMLRDGCGSRELAPLLARGVVVHESRSFGPRQIHVFTLTLSSAICDQMGMEVILPTIRRTG